MTKPTTVSLPPQAINVPRLTLKQVMQALGVSRSTVYRFMETGRLTKYKVGAGLRFFADEVEAIPVRDAA